MNLQTLEEALERQVSWTLPNNYPVAGAAVNQGLPIEKRDFKSDIARSYAGVTDAIIRSLAFPGGGESLSAPPARSRTSERWRNAMGPFK